MKYFISLFILLLTNICLADSAVLSWDANSESDIAGYKIYYGTSFGVYPHIVDVGNNTTYVVDNLIQDKKYFFVVTAYDFAGNESGFSKEVSYPPTVVYPNPFREYTTIYAGEKGDVRIFNILGQLVKTVEVGTVIDMTLFPPGVYFFKSKRILIKGLKL